MWLTGVSVYTMNINLLVYIIEYICSYKLLNIKKINLFIEIVLLYVWRKILEVMLGMGL